MFHDIPQAFLKRIRELEQADAHDRLDRTIRLERLRQIPPESGRFIVLLAATSPPGRWVEIGTSAGYSALWLALAARDAGTRVTTYELLADKAELARQTFAMAGADDVVDLVHGDALDHLGGLNEIAFCFLDAEKEVYGDCCEAVLPRMVAGGLLVADNAITHEAALRPMLDRALGDERVDTMIVPVGKVRRSKRRAA